MKKLIITAGVVLGVLAVIYSYEGIGYAPKIGVVSGDITADGDITAGGSITAGEDLTVTGNVTVSTGYTQLASSTTVGLTGTTPSVVGQMWFDSDLKRIAVSTGTAICQFAYTDDYTTGPNNP